jgi:hypothetical protein
MTRADLGAAAWEHGRRAGQFVASRPDWMLERLSRVNTTNFRAMVTIGLIAWTGIRYLTATDQWVPTRDWLAFLLLSAGVDVTQWYAKRRTFDPDKAEAAAGMRAADAVRAPDRESP